MRQRRLAFLAGLLTVLVAPTVAQADSAGATVRTLPQSEELQVHAEYHHECSGEPGTCDWFTEASAYSSSAGCPAVFDASHIIWSGPPETGSLSFANFSFAPNGLGSEIVVCLYIWSNEESTLVGQSHPFNRETGREVLPRPPRGRCVLKGIGDEVIAEQIATRNESCEAARNLISAWLLDHYPSRFRGWRFAEDGTQERATRGHQVVRFTLPPA